MGYIPGQVLNVLFEMLGSYIRKMTGTRARKRCLLASSIPFIAYALAFTWLQFHPCVFTDARLSDTFKTYFDWGLVTVTAVIGLAVFLSVPVSAGLYMWNSLTDKALFVMSLIAVAFVSTYVPLLAVSGMLGSLGRQLPCGSNQATFSNVVWKAGDAMKPDPDWVSPRQKMLGNLVFNVLPGKSKSEISEILGPQSAGDPAGDNVMQFQTGKSRKRASGVDEERLLIWFDDNNLFEKYTLLEK